MEEQLIKLLISKAKEARKYSYAPYSGFQVGAALLSVDSSSAKQEIKIYTGCNIENAAYSPGNCAERTAVFKAVSEGIRDFSAIAIVGGKGDNISEYTAPCGMCRQVLREFVEPSTFRVIMAINENDFIIKTLEELMPMSFGPDNLKA